MTCGIGTLTDSLGMASNMSLFCGAIWDFTMFASSGNLLTTILFLIWILVSYSAKATMFSDRCELNLSSSTVGTWISATGFKITSWTCSSSIFSKIGTSTGWGIFYCTVGFISTTVLALIIFCFSLASSTLSFYNSNSWGCYVGVDFEGVSKVKSMLIFFSV